MTPCSNGRVISPIWPMVRLAGVDKHARSLHCAIIGLPHVGPVCPDQIKVGSGKPANHPLLADRRTSSHRKSPRPREPQLPDRSPLQFCNAMPFSSTKLASTGFCPVPDQEPGVREAGRKGFRPLIGAHSTGLRRSGSVGSRVWRDALQPAVSHRPFSI